MIPTAQYCSQFTQKECKQKKNKKLCKFKKRTGCGPNPTAPAMITAPANHYGDYSATCLVSSTKTECMDNGCDWNNGACAAFAKDGVKYKNFSDMTICPKYGCRVKKKGCRG